MAPIPPLDVLHALDAEDAALSGGQPTQGTLDWPTITTRLHTRRRSALCFSGGGIRSAAFGLGVMQGLAALSDDPHPNDARPKLLGEFDYLSTVSGGGYLGSWFSAWATRLAKPAKPGVRNVTVGPDALDGPAAAIRQLRSGATAGLDPDIAPVAHLREYSNYLTPQLGLLSGDTWAVVGAVVRNVLLNWLVLLPLAAAMLMVPVVARHVAAADVTDHRYVLNGVMFVLALASGALATGYIGFDLPSAGDAKGGWTNHFWCCLIPLTISAVAFNVLWAWLPAGTTDAPWWDLLARGQTGLRWWHFCAIGAVMYGGGMAAGIAWAMLALDRPAPKVGIVATLAAIVAGGLGGLVALHFAHTTYHLTGRLADPALYTILAFPTVIGVFLVAATLLVGLTSYITEDKDREWWSRSGGLLLFFGLAWLVLATIVLYVPLLVVRLEGKLTIHLFTTFAGWASSQLAGSAATPSHDSGARQDDAGLMVRAKQLGAKALLPLFLVSGAVSLALLNHTLFRLIATHVPAHRTLAAVALTVAYAAFAVISSFFINVNSFSLHGMYRERLIRAFLGASTPNREPNKFTGFDDADNMPMAALTSHRPLHVINMALNLVHGKNLAWQERKAESFTVTRLHAGGSRIGYRPSTHYGGHYKDWPKPKDPITLGTAMTISGAAASPNMGYNSSPMLTLVMTLFNARLGWWLGNPKKDDRVWKRPGPRVGLRPIIAEAFGLTDDTNKWIYLSDGGHFENLGLYEMVLRRCAIIVVSDAGADPKYAYEDLGNAVRKIRIDMGIQIEFEEPMPMSPSRAATPGGGHPTGHHCAIGRIRYDLTDPNASKGLLVYLKPSLNGDEPSDVLHYASTDPTFPHQTTIDQFFSEAQFESYRRLGAHIVEKISQKGKRPADAPATFDLRQFCESAGVYRASPHP